jgi:hypothetical protein
MAMTAFEPSNPIGSIVVVMFDDSSDDLTRKRFGSI